MTLYEAQKGQSYNIEGLYVEPAITRRLQALGLNDGTVVKILNRKKQGALIIQVRGTRLALGRHIASSIQVGEAGEEGKGHAEQLHAQADSRVEERAAKDRKDASKDQKGAAKDQESVAKEGKSAVKDQNGAAKEENSAGREGGREA